MSVRIIKNVTLVEINPMDGTQKYSYGEEFDNVVFLSGIDRASNVKIGDVGQLVYTHTPSRGYYVFVKETK